MCEKRSGSTYIGVSFQGINVNQKFDGRPLLVFAADYGHADILEFLLSRGASIDVIFLLYFFLF